MLYLSEIFRSVPVFKELLADIKAERLPAVINGTATIHKAHTVAALSEEVPTIMLIAADEPEASRLCADLLAMDVRAVYYPARDFSFHPLEGQSRDFEHSRIEILCALLSHLCDVVVTVADAVMQYTLPPEQLAQRTVTLEAGAEYSVEHILRALAAGGYERTDCVEGAGQFSARGGIIDFFPPNAESPVRVEMFGDEIDTISYFDVMSQRRTEPVDSIALFPAAELALTDHAALSEKLVALAKSLRGTYAPVARERLLREAASLANNITPASCDKYLPLICDRQATIFDYLPENALMMVSEHTAVSERADAFFSRLQEEVKLLLEDGFLCRGLTEFSMSDSELWSRLSRRTVFMDTFAHGNFDFPLGALRSLTARQLPPWNGTVSLLLEDITPLLDTRYSVVVAAGSPKAADALCGDLQATNLDAIRTDDPTELKPGRVAVTAGGFSYGFDYPDARIALFTWGRSVGGTHRKPLRKAVRRRENEIQSLSELTVGDLVVHINHGIGMFCGIVKLTSDGIVRDYIKISYAKNSVVYVPVTQLDLVSKYIGAAEDSKVKLSTLGGTDWNKQKTRVRKAVKDIAHKLQKLYAERMRAEGYPFDPDTDYQRDFELRFPYDETEDQLRCIAEIKKDMESTVPMDRLLCGDVGFGKTEVAFRAAFKCIVEGRQCALLAPTTILAWQHYQTALQRFDGFPFRIELLSRFRTPKQQEQILHALKRGEVDFVIGTHRIVQKDVQFRDLGLAIIDEEQRFGVAQKEAFKEAFNAVDQLTLSATPIPRTLNMAMSGLRDISSLEEAPVDRMPVQTYVIEYNEAIIADAIRRELRRGGQVYYLHNIVGDIEHTAERVQKLAPDAVIGIAHGKMSEQEISREWKRLVDHEIDILVCTTIIESGVDVANANTLIVENAENFGLSQLHQIRGRVGRSNRRAYAYLTFNGRKQLTDIASKRLMAIREFTQFGSGIKIAMRDLELRGAGNILGGEQSGHLDMVGYDLYLKMLNEAVQEEKGEEIKRRVETHCSVDLPIDAHIPESYIDATTIRLDVYRLIADIRSDEDASEVVDELIDRFGEPPAAVMGLIRVALIRNLAAGLGFSEIKQNGDKLVFYFAESELDLERVSKYAQSLPGRVMVTPGAKTYLAVRSDKSMSLIDNVADMLGHFEKSVRAQVE